MLASCEGHLEVAKFLVSNGADVFACNSVCLSSAQLVGGANHLPIFRRPFSMIVIRFKNLRKIHFRLKSPPFRDFWDVNGNSKLNSKLAVFFLLKAPCPLSNF
jgi:hypothetical protein